MIIKSVNDIVLIILGYIFCISFFSCAMEERRFYVIKESENYFIYRLSPDQSATACMTKIDVQELVYIANNIGKITNELPCKKLITTPKKIISFSEARDSYSRNLYKSIESRHFPKTYALIEKGMREKIFSPLGSKFSDVLSKKISFVEEFCKDLIEFPRYTGAMVIAMASFGQNEAFLSDYKAILSRISVGSMVPIMLSLVKNSGYRETNFSKNGSASNSSLFSANDM